MSKPNPLLLNSVTRFAPFNGRAQSRSPSRSPTRKAEFTAHELDPLLSNLSPKSTLEALSATEAIQPEGQKEQDVLAKSIAQASTTERALGIRAAVAAQKLREWYAEVSAWPWADPHGASSGKGFEPPKSAPEEQYFGSLPAGVLEKHEDRVEEIKDGMEALDVEELKEHVLNAHIPSRSRPSSSNGQTLENPYPLSYTQMRDFTAVITATILQALPLLSHLNTLLATWDVRFSVLRQIPSLLRSLASTRDAIESAWSAVGSEPADPHFSKDVYQRLRHDLEAEVSSLGAKMDQILDALEGREDVLPEAWIDDMDGIEADWGNWVVEAEQVLLRQDLRAQNADSTEPPVNANTTAEIVDSISRPQSSDDLGTDHVISNPTAAPRHLGPVTAQSQDPGKALAATAEIRLGTQNATLTDARKLQQELQSLTPRHSTGLPLDPSSASGSNLTTTSNTGLANHKHDSVLSTSRDENLGVVHKSTQELLSNHEPKFVASSVPTGIIRESASKGDVLQTKPLAGVTSSAAAEESDLLPASLQASGVVPDEVQLLGVEQPSEGGNDVTNADDRQAASVSTHEVSPSLRYTQSKDEPLSKLEAPYSFPATRPPPMSSIGKDPSFQPSGEAKGLFPEGIGRLDEERVATPTNLEMLQDVPLKTSNGRIGFLEPANQDQARQGRRPPPLDISSANSHRRSTSNLSALSSGVSDYLSDLSTPEILDASTAEVHASPVVVDSPYRTVDKDYFSTSRASSVNQKARTRSMYMPSETVAPTPPKQTGHTRAISVPLASLAMEPKQPQEENDAQDAQSDQSDEVDNVSFKESSPMIKRASFASIGSLPKSELRTITVSRASSPASVVSTRSKLQYQDHIDDAFSALTGTQSVDKDGGPITESSPLSPPRTRATEQRFLMRPPHEEEPSLLRVATQPKFTTQDVEPGSSPPIPRRSSKRTSRNLNFSTSPSTPVRGKKQGSPQSPGSAGTSKSSPSKNLEGNKPLSPPKSHEETLEEKIHDLLTTIPARIHLASAPALHRDSSSPKLGSQSRGKETDVGKDAYSLSSRSISNGPSTRSTTPTPIITLTPMKPSRTGPLARTSEDPSIAVYHLSRGGPGSKDAAPIKLFVRLVGHNPERVMVRVGGGWADLGEYLREYALHHGHRTVSDGRFEVQGLQSQKSSPIGLVPTSRTPNAFLQSGKKRSPNSSRPASALDFRPSSALDLRTTRRGSAASSDISNPSSPVGIATSTEFGTPPPVPSIPARHRKSSLSSVGTPTTTSFTTPTSTTTTTSTLGFHNPSSTTNTRTTSNSYTPLGAAGPKSQQSRTASAMNPESEAWVEGVLGQARRTTSANVKNSPATSTPSSAGRGLSEKPPREDGTPGSGGKIGGIKRVFLKSKERLWDDGSKK